MVRFNLQRNIVVWITVSISIPYKELSDTYWFSYTFIVKCVSVIRLSLHLQLTNTSCATKLWLYLIHRIPTTGKDISSKGQDIMKWNETWMSPNDAFQKQEKNFFFVLEISRGNEVFWSRDIWSLREKHWNSPKM